MKSLGKCALKLGKLRPYLVVCAWRDIRAIHQSVSTPLNFLMNGEA